MTGAALLATPDATTLDAARAAAGKALARETPPHPCELSGLHNPWRYGASQNIAWPLLSLCEDARVVDALRALVGPDIVLWDSELYPAARLYRSFAAAGLEGRYWPATPLAGAVAIFPMAGPHDAALFDLSALRADPPEFDPALPLFVARYMPATSFYDRDPQAPANRRCMEERVLFNYANRPLWLVSGEDRAGSDFVRGFAAAIPRLAGPTLDPFIPPRRA